MFWNDNTPAVYWFFGGDDPKVYNKAKKAGTLSSLPTNHNPRLRTGDSPHTGNGREGIGGRSACLVGVMNKSMNGQHPAGHVPG